MSTRLLNWLDTLPDGAYETAYEAAAMSLGIFGSLILSVIYAWSKISDLDLSLRRSV